MKKLLALLVFVSFISNAQKTVTTVTDVSRKDLKDYNMGVGLRFMYRKIPQLQPDVRERQFIGNLTTDTLIAAIAQDVKQNLIVTPDQKVVMKTAQKIELYKEFESEAETETNFAWKGKTIYTQKILLTWASPSVQILSGVDYLYYAKMVDFTYDPNGNESRVVPMLGPTIQYNPTTHTITAYRPGVETGHYGQRAEIIIQYTKQ